MSLLTCPNCNQTGFTPRGLQAHMKTKTCASRRAEATPVATSPGFDPAGKLVSSAILIAASNGRAALDHLRSSCGHALQAGAALVWIHERIADSANGSRAGSSGGFSYAIEKTGIPRRTAYNWMNAFGSCMARLGLNLESLPDPDTKAWTAMMVELGAIAAGTSLRRLMLGAAKAGTEEARLDELISRAESGDQAADEAMERVASGEWTLVQAIRAASGQAATKGSNRRDPVYLAIDGRNGALRGLLPKATITLANAFTRWDDLDEPARRAFRASWLELVSRLPDELR